MVFSNSCNGKLVLTSYIQEDEASDYMNQPEDSTHRREYCLDKL